MTEAEARHLAQEIYEAWVASPGGKSIYSTAYDVLMRPPEPPSPYGVPPEDVPIPEGWERAGETKEEWFRLALKGEPILHVNRRDVPEPARLDTTVPVIIVRRKHPRRWIVDLLSSPYPETEGVDGHLKGIGIRGVGELPRVDDALLDKLVGIAMDAQKAALNQRVDESRRYGMRAALKELGIA